MFKKYLEKIQENKLELISSKDINGKMVNTSIFKEGIPKDLKKYKLLFTKQLETVIKNLNKIKSDIDKQIKIPKNQKEILNYEINYSKGIAKFLSETYDIEAKKINNRYKIENKKINYDYYNNLFFGVTIKDLNKRFIIKNNSNNNNIEIKKEKLIELLSFSKSIVQEIEYEFTNTKIMYHNKGKIYIPSKSTYSIENIIVLFFHETTHLFRYINGTNNLGFEFQFSDYSILEEGISLYNEYKYGNKIINYGKYNPYYDKCYKILLEDINEYEKKEKIYEILKNKGFSKIKSKKYYERFYRYSILGSKNLFLKDMIYTKSYLKVKEIIKKDKLYYDKIMKGRIGSRLLDSELINHKNNINTKHFFYLMVKKIKLIIK